MLGPGYARGLDEYDAAYESVTYGVWQDHYLDGIPVENGAINPLPDVLYLAPAMHGA